MYARETVLLGGRRGLFERKLKNKKQNILNDTMEANISVLLWVMVAFVLFALLVVFTAMFFADTFGILI